MATLVTLSELRKHLRLQDKDEAVEAELRSMLESVTSVVEARVGWVAKRPMTFSVTGGGANVVLPGANVLSVVSATDRRTGAAIDVDGIEVEHGVLSRVSGGRLPAGPWSITVMVGMDPIPAALRNGALEIIREAWDSTKGGPAAGSSTRTYLVSYRAEAWLEGLQQGPGFA